MKTLSKILSWLFIAGLCFMMLVNVQPWMRLAKELADQIRYIPFLSSLVQIPLIGGWIAWIALNLSQFLGVILWGTIQAIETLPMLLEEHAIKQPQSWMTSLERYKGGAYIFEAIVCFMAFPPYKGGIDMIVRDFPNWDANLIDWWAMIYFTVTMFGFEFCLRVALRVWEGMKRFNSVAVNPGNPSR
ncbi:hypothetical protein ACKFKF_11585 [Phormidesmis sp. 146-12]